MFDKYELTGAYHWRECDRSSSVFNPPLVARYGMITARAVGAHALDIGAGDGYLTAQLAKRCAKVTGLEYDAAGVQLAAKMLANIENAGVSQGSAYKLPYADRSFDVLTMADVIEHLDTPECAVREMARVAKCEATTFVTTPQKRADRVWDTRHVKEYTAGELASLLEIGFAKVELVFAWPRFWSDFYNTRIGWRVLRWSGRMGFNPFRQESADPEGYCQILAIAREPRR